MNKAKPGNTCNDGAFISTNTLLEKGGFYPSIKHQNAISAVSCFLPRA
jgi:hypothetical protein